MADKEPGPEAKPAVVQTDPTSVPGTTSPIREVSQFPLINDTQEKEDAFDLIRARNLAKPTGLIGTIAYIIKGALGAGILGSHAGFASAGLIAVPTTVILAIYMCSCLIVLVKSAQIIYKRTEFPKMSYADVGQASFTLSQSSKVRKMAKPFRYFIDFVVCLDLFGACCCYQLMIAGTIKQIVENQQKTSFKGLGPGYPNLRIYMCGLMLPIVLLCCIKRLDILAKFSIVGNFLIAGCVIATVYYSLQVNPTMTGMKYFTSFQGFLTYMGMVSFSMSCSGIVVTLECNMSKPQQFPLAMSIGMIWIAGFVMTIALFGYSAYGEGSTTPITFHFPMTWFPKVLKIGIAFMLLITHAVNYYVPFVMVFHYIKKLHKPEKLNCVEYIYRIIFGLLCTVLGIVFPSVNKLMSFIGAFAITNMAFIFPTTIWLATIWHRPGLGKAKWRLITGVAIIAVGLFIFIAGTIVSIKSLVELFSASEERIDDMDHYVYTGEYNDDYYEDYYYNDDNV